MSSAYNRLKALQDLFDEDWDGEKQRAFRPYEKVANDTELRPSDAPQMYHEIIEGVEEKLVDYFRKMSRDMPQSQLAGFETPQASQLYKVINKYPEKESANPLDLAGLTSSQMDLLEVYNAIEASSFDSGNVSWISDEEFVEIDIE